jgi:signal transduction histidine kinase
LKPDQTKDQKRDEKRKPRRRWRPGIKWSLFASFLTFSLILVALLWTFQIVFLDRFYRAIKTSQIRRTAATIAENINHTELDTLITQIAQHGDFSIRIVTISGNDLASFEIGPASLINHLPLNSLFELYDKTKAAGGEYLEYYDRLEPETGRYDARQFAGNALPGGGRASLIYCRLVTLDNGTSAVILLNTLLTPVTATVETLRVQLIYISVILIVLSLVLALILSRRIARPIIQINETSKEMAAGWFDVHFQAADYREISELADTLNHTARELGRVEALRRELIANISHDLRTPLTMIRGYAEVMRDLPGENNPEIIQVIIDEANRLTNLVNSILDLSRLQAGAANLEKTEYNLTRSVRDSVDRVRKMTEAEGYQIAFAADQDVRVRADPARIEQVIYNLLTNAVHYAGPDRRIDVVQTVKDGMVKIAVTDYGEGIDPDELPYIWDRYYKSDKTHRRAVVGSGLGLSIVKSILEQHEARFGVESTPGQGSTFWFELPVSHNPQPEEF